MSVTDFIKSAITRGKKAFLRRVATLWQYVYRAQYRFGEWIYRYGGLAFVSVLILLVATSFYLWPKIQNVLEAHYSTEQSIEGLRSLIQNIGGALIGAAAIVTSLVLFAMQVNIERMPHGLFRRLSADKRLLSAFALTFLLAIGIAVLSTFIEQNLLALIVLSASWATIFIIVLFLYAYRRALILINPLQQLGILINDTRREFRIWQRRAKRAMPLLEQDENADVTPSSRDSTHDLARTTFFQINNRWTDGPKQAIEHAMSFARRYAEQRDHEVSEAALKAVIGINAAYIDTKGKTFYANNAFIDNPLASDDFINDTLEHLLKNIQSGIAHRDEQQIKQTLQAMAALFQVYLGIDYSSQYASKSHSHLAAVYLADAIESLVPHNMADVLLEGQRLMGKSAQDLITRGDQKYITILSEKIAMIACSGCAREDYRPVTREGMMQLADLTFALLRFSNHDISFEVGKVRQAVTLVVKSFLKVPDTPLSSSHSTYLGPYYSSTSGQSLRSHLTTLANTILESESDNEGAQTVTRNIEQWAGGIYKTEKELLLEAIKAKSHFTFDIIHWITGVTEVLLAVSKAAVCDDCTRGKLRKHARWLIATLTWIPDDKETVTFIEHFQMTETLFEAAIDAHNRGCDEIANEIGKILLSWTFKGGRYQTGWGVLQTGLCGAAVFALMCGDERTTELLASVGAELAKESAPDQNIRDRAAREIRKRATTLHRDEHSLSLIERGIAYADHGKLRPLLEDIAQRLSPISAQ